MTEAFNKWWNEDLLTEDNPYVEGTAAYWAWEGWCAAVKAEREACAKVFDDRNNGIGFYEPHEPAEIIRAKKKT
jgi:hypothetical protein